MRKNRKFVACSFGPSASPCGVQTTPGYSHRIAVDNRAAVGFRGSSADGDGARRRHLRRTDLDLLKPLRDPGRRDPQRCGISFL